LRLEAIFQPDAALGIDRALDADDVALVGRIAEVLAEAAADGAVYVEVRCGSDLLVRREDFMARFRDAERWVQQHYPRLRAEAIGYLRVIDAPEQLRAEERRLEACLRAARDGLGGVDFRVDPYDVTSATADPALWGVAYRWAERAAAAGLGITVHVGEFGTASVAAALRIPGLRRIGHGTRIASDPHLLDQLVRSGVTVECALTCNVVLGSAPSYEDHPIRQFAKHGIPVTLATDLPMHVCTSIGREYAIAAALGFSHDDLMTFTRNAVAASFTTATRRAAIFGELELQADPRMDQTSINARSTVERSAPKWPEAQVMGEQLTAPDPNPNPWHEYASEYVGPIVEQLLLNSGHTFAVS
jgi:imidazolonepropionase-like amidohydrolase